MYTKLPGYSFIKQWNFPNLQTNEQRVEYCKTKLKVLYDTPHIPFSPLILHFVQKKESDFNISLLTHLSELYHTECFFKLNTTLNEYLKMGTYFSQSFDLCLDEQNTNTLDQTRDSFFEESTMKVLNLKIYDRAFLDTLHTKRSRYVSQQIKRFFEMLMKTQVQVYHTYKNKRILKTKVVCFEHFQGKDNEGGVFNQVAMHPYFFCQAVPFTMYYNPPIQTNYFYTCLTFNKGYKKSSMPYKLFVNFVIAITKGEDFLIENQDYPMEKTKDKETFSCMEKKKKRMIMRFAHAWLLIHVIETVMNSFFFESVMLLYSKDPSFLTSDVDEIQRAIVKSNKKKSLLIRAIPKPENFCPYFTGDAKTSLVLSSLF